MQSRVRDFWCLSQKMLDARDAPCANLSVGCAESCDVIPATTRYECPVSLSSTFHLFVDTIARRSAASLRQFRLAKQTTSLTSSTKLCDFTANDQPWAQPPPRILSNNFMQETGMVEGIWIACIDAACRANLRCQDAVRLCPIFSGSRTSTPLCYTAIRPASTGAGPPLIMEMSSVSRTCPEIAADCCSRSPTLSHPHQHRITTFASDFRSSAVALRYAVVVHSRFWLAFMEG